MGREWWWMRPAVSRWGASAVATHPTCRTDRGSASARSPDDAALVSDGRSDLRGMPHWARPVICDELKRAVGNRGQSPWREGQVGLVVCLTGRTGVGRTEAHRRKNRDPASSITTAAAPAISAGRSLMCRPSGPTPARRCRSTGGRKARRCSVLLRPAGGCRRIRAARAAASTRRRR